MPRMGNSEKTLDRSYARARMWLLLLFPGPMGVWGYTGALAPTAYPGVAISYREVLLCYPLDSVFRVSLRIDMVTWFSLNYNRTYQRSAGSKVQASSPPRCKLSSVPQVVSRRCLPPVSASGRASPGVTRSMPNLASPLFPARQPAV